MTAHDVYLVAVALLALVGVLWLAERGVGWAERRGWLDDVVGDE